MDDLRVKVCQFTRRPRSSVIVTVSFKFTVKKLNILNGNGNFDGQNGLHPLCPSKRSKMPYVDGACRSKQFFKRFTLKANQLLCGANINNPDVDNDEFQISDWFRTLNYF